MPEEQQTTALPEVLKSPADAESYAEYKKIRMGEKVTANLDVPVVEKPSEPAPGESEGVPETPETPEPEETEKSQQEEKPAQDKPRRDRSAEGRISELYARAKAAEDNAARLQRELEQARQATRPASEQPPAQPQPQPQRRNVEYPADDPLPNIEDYKEADGSYSPAYWDARAQWNTRQVMREQVAQMAAVQQQQEAATRLRSAIAKYPDYQSALTLELTPAMQQYVATTPNGWEVAYHLSKDPESHARLLSLPPVLQVAELGRLESRYLGANGEPQKPAAPAPVSRVPQPIRRVSGAESQRKSTSEATSYAEHKSIREAELKAGRG